MYQRRIFTNIITRIFTCIDKTIFRLLLRKQKETVSNDCNFGKMWSKLLQIIGDKQRDSGKLSKKIYDFLSKLVRWQYRTQLGRF
jgi:hypothetical protein